MSHSRNAVLLRDITAGELAMDYPGGDGYPADHVIGRAGSAVTVVSVEGDSAEVTGFSDDEFAAGFVPVDALRMLGGQP